MILQASLSDDSSNMVKERILRLKVGSSLMFIGAFTLITLRPIIEGVKNGEKYLYIFQTHTSDISIGLFISFFILIFTWRQIIDVRKHLIVSIAGKSSKLFLITTFDNSEALVDLFDSKIDKKWNLQNGNFFNKTAIFVGKYPLEMFKLTLLKKNMSYYLLPQLFDSEEQINSFINLIGEAV
jgi:hypothetical protein